MKYVCVSVNSIYFGVCPLNDSRLDYMHTVNLACGKETKIYIYVCSLFIITIHYVYDVRVECTDTASLVRRTRCCIMNAYLIFSKCSRNLATCDI